MTINFRFGEQKKSRTRMPPNMPNSYLFLDYEFSASLSRLFLGRDIVCDGFSFANFGVFLRNFRSKLPVVL